MKQLEDPDIVRARALGIRWEPPSPEPAPPFPDFPPSPMTNRDQFWINALEWWIVLARHWCHRADCYRRQRFWLMALVGALGAALVAAGSIIVGAELGR